jgi:hypothetical protein
MEPDDLLCSRNARPEKALVGRAQWKINQPPSLRDNERAWREHYRNVVARCAQWTTPAALLNACKKLISSGDSTFMNREQCDLVNVTD